MATAKKTTKKAPKTASSGEFAVIATGGKQYRVSVGQTITIEKLKQEVSKGDAITFDKVLLTDNSKETAIGTPHLAGVTVTGEVVSVGRAPKVTVIKYKQKSRYFKKNGHQQPQLKVTITAIQ